MEQYINIITLGVSDLDKSLSFYEKGLGWKKSDNSNQDVVFFDMGGVVLSLFSRAALAKDADQKADGSGFRGFTLAHNTKSENEVDSVLGKVEKLGAEIVKPAQETSWGGYSGYFKDYDGHLFEVAFNPHFTFDENNDLKM